MVYNFIRLLVMSGSLLILLPSVSLGQTGTLKGQLSDAEDNEAIIGANVFIQDLNKGSSTNSDGNFTIKNIPYGTYNLRISFIGYSPKTVVVTIDQKVVSLKETLSKNVSQLEDIVVTAYGVEKRINELPYSAQEVQAEEITEGGLNNFVDAFSGRVSGMKVQSASGMGGSTDIVLRGNSSLTGNNQALFVVDGVPYANERFNSSNAESGYKGYDYGTTGVDINPESIESITILKGPAAAALYGSRASNGAILIETKKGGSSQGNVDISFKTSVGVKKVNPQTFPDFQNEYGAGYSSGFLSQDINGDGIDDRVARYTADASWGPKFDSNLKVYQWDSFYEGFLRHSS